MKNLILFLSLLAVAALALPALAMEHGGERDADQKFVKKAALGGLMEVELGQLAQEKGEASEVQEFGRRMVEDHGQANSELSQLAQQKGWELPTELDQKHQNTVDQLQRHSGEEFDQRYMREMVKDHTKDVRKFEKAKEKVSDPELLAFIEKTLPVLEEHLQLARQTAEQLGVNVAEAEAEAEEELEEKEEKK
ncbi:MAG: DUF4142 domain-containing protein [Desulfuromonadales bacterium]|nr:DUF4142 domain-containing protein [Desulfuromonadales bacterium]